MDSTRLLDQILHAARDLGSRGRTAVTDALDLPKDPEQAEQTISALGKGAAAGAVLALVLGTGLGRRLAGTALKLGSLAAIGTIAYQAIRSGSGHEAGAASPVDELTGDEARARSRLLLRAMLAAARADGHIDDNEMRRIEHHVGGLGMDDETADLIKSLLAESASPDDLAAAAANPETAAEIYLVSRLVIDRDNETEARYLDRLIRALDLDYSLVSRLEDRLGSGEQDGG